MSITQENGRTEHFLHAGQTMFRQMLDHIWLAARRREAEATTRFELSCLSDRELRDLGITRGDIMRLAKEAANGRS